MLLYAYNQPVFVVDAYTRRFLIHQEIISEEKICKMSYDDIKKIEKHIPKNYKTYREYRALIVFYEKNDKNRISSGITYQ